MNNHSQQGFFTVEGKNLAFTFFLIASLFLLWGFCNSMIDTMDKHFQDQLNLTKAQSAWVQFAHYMGYALMALPAGLVTRRLGYKYGIIFGLLLVGVGAFWFLPATRISQFWAFLLGVCVIAMGLTVLETVANPYTTVLGPKQYGASRINLAQSFNGIGWILGPIAGASFFYSEGGVQKAHGQLFIPYLGVGVLVLILALLVHRAYVPDIKVEDEYHTDDHANTGWKKNHGLVLLMLILNVGAVALSTYLVLHTILPAASKTVTEAHVDAYWWAFIAIVVAAIPILVIAAKRVTTHSIWAHPHFSGATLAQFFYVAAQAGIFSFFINSMTVDKHNGSSIVPELPASWAGGMAANKHWIEVRTSLSGADIVNLSALAERLKNKPDPVAAFLASQLPATTLRLLAQDPGTAPEAALRKALVNDLNGIMRQELDPKQGKPAFYDAERFRGVALSDKARQLAGRRLEVENDHLRFNRLLLAEALPGLVRFRDGVWCISDAGAGYLSSLAFGFFLLGRLISAWAMRRAPAHKMVGAFALANVILCALVIAKLGWLSVAGVFLTYFFMSLMFPTIFALGIFGLGSQAKKKAAAFIVMSITGGALMPKLMGRLGDVYDMSTSFWIPLGCFVLILVYGFSWSKLSQAEGIVGMKTAGGH
ncbi:MAG TPA: MFS transporter [Verrucomicrobiota bacterium]|nr:MFS transporter [Verrucomicrobiota bacterium]